MPGPAGASHFLPHDPRPDSQTGNICTTTEQVFAQFRRFQIRGYRNPGFPSRSAAAHGWLGPETSNRRQLRERRTDLRETLFSPFPLLSPVQIPPSAAFGCSSPALGRLSNFWSRKDGKALVYVGTAELSHVQKYQCRIR